MAFHIALGFSVYIFERLSTIYLALVLIYFFFRLIKNGNRNNEALFAAVYITAGEVFFRMTNAAPAYEFAKYGVIGFLFVGMFFKGFSIRAFPYLIFLLLLIPGVFVALENLAFDADFRKRIVFNLSGPLCLGIAALYCYNLQVTRQQLLDLMVTMLLPVITTAIYLYFYTPSTQDFVTGTASNYAFSGGFGPNQVSTALGIGMFVLFARIFIIKNFYLNVVDLVLLLAVSYRAWITFSRGGVLTAGFMMVAFIGTLYIIQRRAFKTSGNVIKITAVVAGLAAAWIFTSIRTNGMIVNRYSNQDAIGREKEDISTGRMELIQSELGAFYDNPISGIGVGGIREYREINYGITANTHNEISRLLSEHGLAGIFCMILLIGIPLSRRAQHKTNPFFYPFLVFWFLTINHSSMRIAAPAMLYGLTLLYERKDSIHRE